MRGPDLVFVLLVMSLALLNAVVLADRGTTPADPATVTADSVRAPTVSTTLGGLR